MGVPSEGRGRELGLMQDSAGCLRLRRGVVRGSAANSLAGLSRAKKPANCVGSGFGSPLLLAVVAVYGNGALVC